MLGRISRGFLPLLLVVLVIVAGRSAHAQCDPVELQKVLPSDGAAGDEFGTSAAISGDTALIGAWQDDDDGKASGAVFVFRLVKGSWTETGKLVPPDGDGFSWFGQSVSMSGDTAVVGAPGASTVAMETGAVYIFYRDEGGPNNWGFFKKLTADDADLQDRLGYSVGISGDTVIAGAYWDEENGEKSGSAYIFYRDHGGPDNWGQVAKMIASDGEPDAQFGKAAAIDGDTAIVGSWAHNHGFQDTGAAYIFQRDHGGADNWGEVTELIPADAQLGDWFGDAVSISGDTVAIGAPDDDDFGSAAGTAHVYSRDQGGADNWGHVAELTRTDPTDIDFFARRIVIDGDIVLVGSTGDDDHGLSSGAAYVYQRDANGEDAWGQVAKFTASDAQTEDFLGTAVAMTDGLAAIGADGDDDLADHAGAAYFVDLNCASACPWDLNDDDLVGTNDLLLLLGSWGDPYGTADLIELLGNWGPCPR